MKPCLPILGLMLALSAVPATAATNAAAATAGTNAPPGAWLLDGPAAQVNGDTIMIAEVMAEIPNSAYIELPREEREARLHSLYDQTLNALIDRKLILSAAATEERKLQGWVVDDRVQEVIDNRFHGDRQQLLAALTGRHLAFDDWRKGIEEDLLLTAMRIEYVDKRVAVSPRDIRGYYETNRQALSTSGGVRVGIITLTVTEKDGETVAQLGERVLKQLDAGADFDAMARKYSHDSHAASGGDWGLVDPAEKFAPAIVQALAALKTGQYSRLVTLGDTGYIIRKVEEKAPTVLTLEEAWPLIDRRLRAKQSEELYREWTDRLRRKAYVRVFELPGPSGRK